MKRSRWDTDPSPPKPPPSAPKSRWDTQVPSSKSNPASRSSSPVPPPSSAPSAPYKRPQPLTFGCHSVENYERLSHIDEGTYGIVWKARSLKTNSLVALKQLKFPESESQAVGFPVAALREISILQDLSHPHILSTHEMVIGSTSSKVFMVMNLMSCDVKVAIERLPEVMSQGEAKSVMWQLVSAVEYMHGKFYLHRDLKTSNVLVSRDTGKVRNRKRDMEKKRSRGCTRRVVLFFMSFLNPFLVLTLLLCSKRFTAPRFLYAILAWLESTRFLSNRTRRW